MSIIVFCKDCGKKIRVPEGPPGRHGRCPQCQALVAIPAESETAPPPAAHLKKVAVDKSKAAGASLGEDAPTPPEALQAVAVEEPPATKAVPVSSPKPPGASTAASEKPGATSKPVTPESAERNPAAKLQEPAMPAKSPAAKPGAPKLRAPTGKPARIALDIKQVEAAAINEKSEKAGDHARAKGSAVAEQFGGVRWDTSPDVPPSRALNVLAAILVVAIGLGYGVWYFFLRSEAKRLSPEERKQLKFEAPAAKDKLHDLRNDLPKNADAPPVQKTEGAREEKSEGADREAPANAPSKSDTPEKTAP